jgi:di/tricarboxylate transporter
MSLMICQTCRGQIAVGAEVCPHCGRALVKTKGVLSIVFWGIVGLFAGAVIAPLVMVVRNQHKRIDELFVLSAVTHGAVIGALVGLCVGLFLWAFFPYKTRPEEPSPDD